MGWRIIVPLAVAYAYLFGVYYTMRVLCLDMQDTTDLLGDALKAAQERARGKETRTHIEYRAGTDYHSRQLSSKRRRSRE